MMVTALRLAALRVFLTVWVEARVGMMELMKLVA